MNAPAGQSGRVAVVIIAAGRRDHLTRTLAHLTQQSRPADDIVVVDMDPSLPIADAVVDPARRVSMAALGDGTGLPLAAARNTGAAATDAERLIFLDVDCLAAGDLVERYVEVLGAYPGTLACGPVRYLRAGWAAGGPGVRDGPDWATLDRLSDAHPARVPPLGTSVRVGDDHELFWSLAFGCSRTTWGALGGFDAGYRGYGAEDTDFALRARRAGTALAWFAGGTAYHQWHEPTRGDESRIAEMVANARRFHGRWGSWPMAGWLQELHESGWVIFDPAGDRLDLVAG